MSPLTIMVLLIVVSGIVLVLNHIRYDRRPNPSRYDSYEWWQFVVAAICALTITALSIVVGILIIERAACNAIGDTGRDTRFSYSAGCFVKIGNEWFPSDAYQDIQIRKGEE